MPTHDWTKVDAGIFHHFHHVWIDEIQRALNRGLLPPEYYALAEQITSHLGPDVLTLRKPGKPDPSASAKGGACVADAPPKVRFHAKSLTGKYAAKGKSVVIRHRSNHEIIARVEIVSPGNKESSKPFNAFVRKAEDALDAGIHLLIVDLFPPSRRDPEGIHRAIWGDREGDFVFSAAQPLTCLSYVGGELPEAYIEPVALGDPLPEMPLFLTPDVFVPVPLEATYQSGWEAVPQYWRDVVAGTAPMEP